MEKGKELERNKEKELKGGFKVGKDDESQPGFLCLSFHIKPGRESASQPVPQRNPAFFWVDPDPDWEGNPRELQNMCERATCESPATV